MQAKINLTLDVLYKDRIITMLEMIMQSIALKDELILELILKDVSWSLMCQSMANETTCLKLQS